jgi:hypothetical protein
MKAPKNRLAGYHFITRTGRTAQKARHKSGGGPYQKDIWLRKLGSPPGHDLQRVLSECRKIYRAQALLGASTGGLQIRDAWDGVKSVLRWRDAMLEAGCADSRSEIGSQNREPATRVLFMTLHPVRLRPPQQHQRVRGWFWLGPMKESVLRV